MASRQSHLNHLSRYLGLGHSPRRRGAVRFTLEKHTQSRKRGWEAHSRIWPPKKSSLEQEMLTNPFDTPNSK